MAHPESSVSNRNLFGYTVRSAVQGSLRSDRPNVQQEIFQGHPCRRTVEMRNPAGSESDQHSASAQHTYRNGKHFFLLH